MPRRWDGDTQGRGVASAASHAPSLQGLLDAMQATDWVAEEPRTHLLPHLETALGRGDSPLRLLAARGDPDGTFSVDLAWSGPPASARDRRAAIFSLVGAIAECSTHVQEQHLDAGAAFDVVTGMLDGDGPFAGHGHTLRLRVVHEQPPA